MIYTTLIIAFMLFSCNQKMETETPIILKEGSWRFSLQISEENKIPFTASFENNAFTIHNAEENISYDQVTVEGDSISIIDPVYDSYFTGKINSDTSFSGLWFKINDCKDCEIPFTAEFNKSRFPSELKTNSFNGKWEVKFSPNDSSEMYPAIGIFENGSGTFITETGDYRYLEGSSDEDEMKLSCFDGAHAFLFAAKLNRDTISGMFYSGKHWQEPWVATRNEKYELTAISMLSYFKEGYNNL